MKTYTIEKIKAESLRSGCYFFEPETMKFFRSQVDTKVFQGPHGVFFVSGERYTHDRGNLDSTEFTVRKFDPETGDVDAHGKPQAYRTLEEARMAAQSAAFGIASRTE